ncbi:Class II histone deacetylase complex subunits 2 and 3 [Fragilaria crotonensis]|nr:Class II histone deacetylase complex subunits 2 and 3 [Fragilaria crotonensis]
MEEWETEARMLQLQGEDLPSLSNLSEEARQNLTERLSEREPMIDRLREIEIQVRNCKNLAEETRAAILRGDQYVNYSSITLKAGGPNSKEGSHLVILKGANGDDIEGRINKAILKVPECGVCPACTDVRSRRLCEERLKVRNELFAKETDMMENEIKKGKGSKKRKHEPPSPKLTGKTSPKTLPPAAKKIIPGLRRSPASLRKATNGCRFRKRFSLISVSE